jgi:hypothetical protein
MSVYYKEVLLRKTCGSGKEQGTGECRKMHNAELHDLYCSWGVGQVTGTRPLGRPGRSWEDNIKMDLK